MTKAVCASCRRSIDAAARVCPYCGANPDTGERVDTQAMLQEIFRPREVSTSESVMEYARQRQGVVIGASLLVVFLVLAGLHQFVTARNAKSVSNAPAVPLTEIADLSNQKDETRPQTLPELPFLYEGKPQSMRTYIMEQGATLPPEIVAAQQAAAQAAAAAKAAQQPQPQAQQPQAQQPRPGVAVQPRPGAVPAQPQPQARPVTPPRR